MKAAEIIESTDALLKEVNSMKDELKQLDPVKDKSEINFIKLKLSQIRRAISRLNEEDQRIICYRYFDNMSYSAIGLRKGKSCSAISWKIKKILLDIGRIIFGMEDEFWDKVCFD